MKKLLFIFIVTSVILAVSCSKDNTETETLSGTIWRYSGTGGIDDLEIGEYILLKFKSSSTAEFWTKYIDENEQLAITYTYVVIDETITLTASTGYSVSGTINGNNMNLTIEGMIITFVKL